MRFFEETFMRDYAKTLSARVNGLSCAMLKEEYELEKSQAIRRTKAELREILAHTIKTTGESARELSRYQNTFEPVKPGDPENSIYYELQRIREDITSVQFMLAKGNIQDADRALQEIKDRI